MIRKWWHSKVAYQIYPKSFYDTNEDGIGDLPGIIQKLDYLKKFGVDILWLSPVYCSPQIDQGYDISDYYNIDPMFGTLKDMDMLIDEAKKRNIHIIMDLVVNHCSDQHEWFKNACKDPDGPYGKFFYIENYHDGDALPTNLRSYFGGSVWDKLPGHDDKIYFHSFHKSQPDLNWENPVLREELYKMICWWLDKGISGFRVDAIINIKKDLPFRHYPADAEDGLCDIINMHKHSRGIGNYLNELKERCFKPYDAFTVGEVFCENGDELPLFFGDDGYFSTIFDFNIIESNRGIKGWYDYTQTTPDDIKKAIFKGYEFAKNTGMMANVFENHDEPRGVSRFIPGNELNEYGKKLLGGLSFMTYGIPFIYQGQEIGMENLPFDDIKAIDDVNSHSEYDIALKAGLSPKEAFNVVTYFSRDNARSPYQWDASDYAGFSTTEPWLRINPNYTKINLFEQMARPLSLWNFYKSLIDLRKDKIYTDTICYGKMIPYIPEQTNIIAFFRKADRTLLVVANFQKDDAKVKLPSAIVRVLLNNMLSLKIKELTLMLQGYQFVILEL